MFDAKTVLILGAGSGREVGFPVGSELATLIGRKMDVHWEGIKALGDGDHSLFMGIQPRDGMAFADYEAAATRIQAGVVLSSSIDDFLNLHQEDNVVLRLGKAAIVKAILEAERQSPLMFDARERNATINFSAIADTWLVKFMRMLGRSVSKQDVQSIFANISFISFDYDRSLEHFLQHALRALYGVSEEEALSLTRDARIFHPYGSVGELFDRNSSTFLNYGGPAMGGVLDYVDAGNRIQTYTEQVAEGTKLDALRAEVAAAERLVFLGFGFHQQNMALLTPPDLLTHKSIYATAMGISQTDIEVVRRRILGMFRSEFQHLFVGSPNPQIRPGMACSAFFDEYALTLPG